MASRLRQARAHRAALYACVSADVTNGVERYPDHSVFVNVHRSLTEGGHSPNQIRAGGRPSFPYEEEVLQEVADDPSISVRGIEERTGIPKSTAHRILQRAEYIVAVGMVMIAKLTFVISVITVTTARRDFYRICTTLKYLSTCMALERDIGTIRCVIATSNLECAFKLTTDEAQIGVFSEEEMMLLAQMQPDAYHAVASIRDDKSKGDLIDKTIDYP
ncbi:hypothetical protein EVAR_65427_1 [Eumeta japonica]|uniref:Uncharacterized protein n=1 Tax=Eumeta variegata TaxID=151549 RepID=A0A4C1YN67_EUMVA|nr:hypothetical protein EVAR_65427_1 [Eumeta japonica]